MALGAVWCPSRDTSIAFKRLREIRQEHNLNTRLELKWSKVSPAKLPFYLDVLDYFLDNDNLHFRCVVAKGKDTLDHALFGQDHDTWYFKMYYGLLNVILSPSDRYNIYLDIKDTRSAEKMRMLHEVICSAKHDFSKRIVQRIQAVRSHEVQLIQLADFLTGIITYVNRGLESSQAKMALVERLRSRTRYDLRRTTLLKEEKVNIFVWTPQDGPQ